MKEPVDGKVRVLELDVLRGFAATMVFLFHCSLILSSSERGVFSLGVTGVDLFFMISGFVILLTLKRTNHWKEFVGNRFVRLFPTYWTCVSFTAILIFFVHLYLSTPVGNLLTDFLGNLTMFPRYMDMPFLDEQYWTLEVEMLFYIFMLVIYLFRGLRSIEIIGYSVLALAVVYDILLEPYFSLKYFSLLNHFPLFFAGILFSRIKTEGASVMRYLGLVCCFIVTCMLFNNGGRSMYYISFAQYLPMVSIYFILFFLVVHQRLGFVVQKPLMFMGRISYSFYLVHQYVSVKIIIPGLQNDFDFSFFMAVTVAFFVSLFLASVITLYIEEPCINLWRKRLTKFD